MGWIKQIPPTDTFIPFTQQFNYTGGEQTLSIPSKGLYKLEVWGARGGAGWGMYTGQTGRGLGGYCCGYRVLSKNEIIKIYCGGMGGDGAHNVSYGGTGGYNGGGNGVASSTGDPHDFNTGGGGGGKTHITDANGITIIAGGGAGGGAGVTYSNPGPAGASANSGVSTDGSGGNGGGYGSGGSAGTYSINGVPTITYKGTTYSPSTLNAQNNGHGYAIITRIA